MLKRRPNVLFYMPDQLRADALSPYAETGAETPAFAALANRGTLFERAYVQHTVCTPSRIAMMTGEYPHVRGHRTLSYLLEEEPPNLLRLARDAGYVVAWTGQRGDALAPGVTPQSADFYGYLVTPTWQRDLEIDHEPGSKWFDTFYAGQRVTEESPVLDADEAETRTAIEWLRAPGRNDAPWFLHMTPIFPHCPFRVEEPWYSQHDRETVRQRIVATLDDKPTYMRELVARYGTDRLTEDDWAEIVGTYYGMVARVDDQFRRVIDTLTETGQLDNTIIVVAADHGEYLGDFGLVEKWPTGFHESIARMPLIVAGPGVRAGRNDAMVESIDVFATIVEAIGATTDEVTFSKSLWPMLEGRTTEHRSAAFTEGGFSVREEHQLEPVGFGFYANKVNQQHENPSSVSRAICIRTPDWTYVHRQAGDHELYDFRRDPFETKNLINDGDRKDVIQDLKERALEWLLDTSDVIPSRTHPRKDPAVQANPFLRGAES